MLTHDICRDMIYPTSDISCIDISDADINNERKMVSKIMDINMEKQEDMTVQSKKKPIKSVVCSLLTLLAFIAIQVAVSGIGATAYMVSCIIQNGGDADTAAQVYMDQIENSGFMTNLLLITTLICGIVALLWYRFGIVKKYDKSRWTEFKAQLNAKNVAKVVVLAIGCYGVALLLAEIIALIVPGSMEDYNEIMSMALGGSEVVAFVTVVILAPVAEELAFRGIIFRMLEKNCPLIVAILLQAVLFGIYHMNIMQGIYVLPLAIALGYVAYRTQSVYPCILMHMVNNFMPTLLSGLPESTPTLPIAAVIIVICAGLLYLLTRGTKTQNVQC